jgi:RimJ/RimL family protein N-acetyltransferase
MNNSEIELIPFEKEHFEFLNMEIADPKFLIQWAGLKYSYPLTWEQMKNKIDELDENHHNKNFLFSVIFEQTEQIIGHIQLSIKDPTLKIGNIGSVLIFKQLRNNGFSKDAVNEVLQIGFSKKRLEEIRLAVFDFNMPALNCYTKIGFKMYEFKKDAIQIENEMWNSIQMKIVRSEYLSLIKQLPTQ